MTTVLVTGMGSANSVAVVRALKRQTEVPVRLVGTDINRWNQIAGSSFCDAFHTVPLAVDADYIPRLLEICEKEQVRILFPVIEPELAIVAAHRADFDRLGVTVWISDPETVLTCNDKYRTFCFLHERGIPTPRTWLPEELADLPADLPYPLILKPRDGNGSHGVRRVDNAQELSEALPKNPRAVVQELVEGREFSIDTVSDWNGNLLGAVPRERLEVKAGICNKGRTVRDLRLIEQARRIVTEMKIRGACNLQCRVWGDAMPFFDVNPRFSGALPLTIEAGVNTPLILVKLALGLPLERDYYDFKENVIMARYWEEVFYVE